MVGYHTIGGSLTSASVEFWTRAHLVELSRRLDALESRQAGGEAKVSAPSFPVEVGRANYDTGDPAPADAGGVGEGTGHIDVLLSRFSHRMRDNEYQDLKRGIIEMERIATHAAHQRAADAERSRSEHPMVVEWREKRDKPWSGIMERADRLASELARLHGEVGRLRGALERYGEHETGCVCGDACDCGLRTAISRKDQLSETPSLRNA